MKKIIGWILIVVTLVISKINETQFGAYSNVDAGDSNIIVVTLYVITVVVGLTGIVLVLWSTKE